MQAGGSSSATKAPPQSVAPETEAAPQGFRTSSMTPAQVNLVVSRWQNDLTAWKKWLDEIKELTEGLKFPTEASNAEYNRLSEKLGFQSEENKRLLDSVYSPSISCLHRFSHSNLMIAYAHWSHKGAPFGDNVAELCRNTVQGLDKVVKSRSGQQDQVTVLEPKTQAELIGDCTSYISHLFARYEAFSQTHPMWGKGCTCTGGSSQDTM
jgi:hypothetical protein